MKTIWIVIGVIALVYVVTKDDSHKSKPVNLKNYPTIYTNTFHGNACTGDCSGHEAGWQWAEDENISTVDGCTGNSQSFIEGCIAYVEDN
jgi:hypothetical protein